MLPLHPRSTLFPYTTLFRSGRMIFNRQDPVSISLFTQDVAAEFDAFTVTRGWQDSFEDTDASLDDLDRKSTRLNSSHGYISYAVFCLKKKKHKRITAQ